MKKYKLLERFEGLKIGTEIFLSADMGKYYTNTDELYKPEVSRHVFSKDFVENRPSMFEEVKEEKMKLNYTLKEFDINIFPKLELFGVGEIGSKIIYTDSKLSASYFLEKIKDGSPVDLGLTDLPKEKPKEDILVVKPDGIYKSGIKVGDWVTYYVLSDKEKEIIDAYRTGCKQLRKNLIIHVKEDSQPIVAIDMSK